MVQPVLAKDEKINNPATKALAALAALAVLPLFLPIPANLNIVLTASLCVFTGCWRSVKATPPADSMSRNVKLNPTLKTRLQQVSWYCQHIVLQCDTQRLPPASTMQSGAFLYDLAYIQYCVSLQALLLLLQDAMTFPLIGSAVLLGLFLLFKFLPKELVNSVLTGYFVLIGIFAVTITILPFVDPIFPAASREKRRAVPKISVPYLLKVHALQLRLGVSMCLHSRQLPNYTGPCHALQCSSLRCTGPHLLA